MTTIFSRLTTRPKQRKAPRVTVSKSPYKSMTAEPSTAHVLLSLKMFVSHCMAPSRQESESMRLLKRSVAEEDAPHPDHFARTQTNHKATTQILQITEQRRWSDFKSCSDDQCADQSRSESACCATVNFDIRGTRLPSSTTLTGSRYITEHTALSDQCLATGKCEVQFWITADFIANPGTNRVPSMPRTIICPLDLSFPPSSVQVQPSNTTAKQHTRIHFKESCNSIFAYCGYSRHLPRQPAEIRFDFPQAAPLPLVRSGPSGQHTFTLPITITITIPSPTSAADATRTTLLRHHLQQKGLERMVSLAACWRTRQRFSIGPAAADHTITKESLSNVAKDINLDFPPFYVLNGSRQEEHTATTYVDLTVPEAAMSKCSYGAELLEIAHSLNLVLSTKGLEMASMPLLPASTAKMWADCSLS